MSEAGHIFCCALPAILSLISLLSALGLMGVVPGFVLEFHDFMHHWEATVIILSALVLALGWSLHNYSKKIDCHSSGCGHKPCKPKKKKTEKILILATVLFAFNLTVYLSVHRNNPILPENGVVISDHSDHIH